jgi:hypothetical protein
MTQRTREERRTYLTWRDMMTRCYAPHRKEYDNYGRRGITVCEKWHDVNGFIEEMGLRPEGMTLERIDNDGPYELGNCKWATTAEQNRNKGTNTILTHNGRTMCAKDWAKELGIPQQTVSYRIQHGYSVEDVLHQGDLRSKS